MGTPHLQEGFRQSINQPEQGNHERPKPVLEISFKPWIAVVVPWLKEGESYEPEEFVSQLLSADSFGANFVAIHLCQERVWRSGQHRCPGVAGRRLPGDS